MSILTGWCHRGDCEQCPGVHGGGVACTCACHPPVYKPPMMLVVSGPEIPRCDATRGPRSRIVCELPYTHEEDWHVGRGRLGQWYHWPDNEGYDGRLRRRQRSVIAALEVGTPLWL